MSQVPREAVLAIPPTQGAITPHPPIPTTSTPKSTEVSSPLMAPLKCQAPKCRVSSEAIIIHYYWFYLNLKSTVEFLICLIFVQNFLFVFEVRIFFFLPPYNYIFCCEIPVSYAFNCNFYASPTSGEAYRDRRLTTNFELWVEIFCVSTCFHMRIPKPCLSVCPSVCLSAPREKKST